MPLNLPELEAEVTKAERSNAVSFTLDLQTLKELIEKTKRPDPVVTNNNPFVNTCYGSRDSCDSCEPTSMVGLDIFYKKEPR